MQNLDLRKTNWEKQIYFAFSKKFSLSIELLS